MKVEKYPSYSKFEFLGKLYNISLLRDNSKVIKKYFDSSHFSRDLLDIDGNLVVFQFDEHVNFGGGSDEINVLYVPVKTKREADLVAKMDKFEIRNIPHLLWGSDKNIYIYED